MPSRLRRHDEPGHIHFWTISCYRRLSFFWHDDMKQVVVDGLRILHERFGICLTAYVVMPDHLHAVLYPHARGDDQPIGISNLLHAFKKHIGFYGKAQLRKIWQRKSGLWSDSLNDWANGRLGKQMIMAPREYHFNIDRPDTLLEKLEYCHKNPVTRSLVNHPQEWWFSSFRYYEHDDRSVLPMNWDGTWPIEW